MSQRRLRSSGSLVELAMRRPVTVMVAVLAVVLTGWMALRQMARDIFPELGIPTVYVAQPFRGMDPGQMESFLTYYYEFNFLYIAGVEHIESKSVQGMALIKIQFREGTDMSFAMSQVVNYVGRALAFMPPGTTTPFVLRFDAGNVPVGNLVFESDTRPVEELQDMALNRVRPLFATLPGVSAPPPFGAAQRTIVLRADPEKMRAYKMSPDEVVRALVTANLIVPSGSIQVGDQQPMVPSNSVVSDIHDLEAVPIRTGSLRTVYMRDIARVEDGSDVHTGYALVNGKRTIYIPVTKQDKASTLEVVRQVKEAIPNFQALLPDDVKVSFQFDQSPYVTRAIDGLVGEGVLGALLTGLMMLVFLGDWRTALLVVVTIPLSLLAALAALWLSGQTINIMTLGGLALAVGVLVDEATVVLENLHAHLERGRPLARAVLDSGREVMLPLLVSMLCVLSVFLPSLSMHGVGRALFVPLSLAVGFSMIAAYALASTFVPVLAVWLLRPHAKESAGERFFTRLRDGFRQLVTPLVEWRAVLVPLYLLLTLAVAYLFGRQLGLQIFPDVETDQFALRMRAPSGTRIEVTEALLKKTLAVVEKECGQPVQLSLGFVGVHSASFPINNIYLWTSGPQEGVLSVQLAAGWHGSLPDLKDRLRLAFARELPEVSYSFEPSDIVTKVMSLGTSTPIQVAVSGPDLEADRAFAERVREALKAIPSLRDVTFEEVLDYPTVEVEIDRERAGLMGVTTERVARSTVIATASSRLVTPIFWRDPSSGVGYRVQLEVPASRMNSLEEIENLPVLSGEEQRLLRSVARVRAGSRPGQYDRLDMQRTILVSANLAGEDLGRVTARVERALRALGPPPRKVNVSLRGQGVPLREMMTSLLSGLGLSVVVVFLLLCANFQAVRLALAVVFSVPSVLAGVVLALWLTGTTLNVQSLMGAIMAVGVAMANAILLVTFAERSRLLGRTAQEAAIDGAVSRLRPILMTSAAMIAGMLPMALALGHGGEQTAPLGRAVVGGLVAATLATLTVLPAFFAMIQDKVSRNSSSVHPDDPASHYYERTPPTPV